MRRGLTLALLAAGLMVGGMGPARAAYGLDQLMGDLAAQKGGRARFVETWHMALLDKPLQSSGQLVYSPPDRLEKRTLRPKPETLILDKDTVSLERDQRKFTLHLSSRPEAEAFVNSIRSTLTGNRKLLERSYQLELSGESQAWVLTLLPTDPAIASLLERIKISGNRGQVRHIEYQQPGGDRSEMSIEPIATP